jgi:hypothetical protein
MHRVIVKANYPSVLYFSGGEAMRIVSLLTVIAFLLSSCSYHGTINKLDTGGPEQTNVGKPRYNAVACIVDSREDHHRLVLDSGAGDTVIEFELCDYLRHNLKDLFAKTMVVKDQQEKEECGIFIYPKQDLVCYGEEMVYNFEMKMNDAATRNQFYSYRTSESGECAKSSPAFMFFSTLLFPPVLGGFFYGMNAHSKSKGNFESAEGMIRRGIDNNIASFANEKVADIHGKQ